MNTGTLYITFVQPLDCLLKLWAQTDKQTSLRIEQALQQVKPEFDAGHDLISLDEVAPGMVCCAKFNDDSYYRARVLTFNQSVGMVEVVYLDYGNGDYIPIRKLRAMTRFPHLMQIAPQAKEYILSNVQSLEPEWSIFCLNSISSQLRYLDFQYFIITQVGKYCLVQLLLQGQDVGGSLFAQSLAANVSLDHQILILQNIQSNMMPSAIPVSPMHSPPPQNQSSAQPKLLTYKCLPLEIGSEHVVYVSYITDGPNLFSIQLQKKEKELQQLMIELNSIPLAYLEEWPMPGSVCLARSAEDDYICRAVVINMVDSNYKVFYVDFGNTEIRSFNCLFQIPFKYVIPKVMAIRFGLNGIQDSKISLEMKVAFKDFVNNKALRMKVAHPAPNNALPLCDLFDENNVNALSVIKSILSLSYPKRDPFTRGFSQEVKVCYVNGCKKFFVQFKCEQEKLSELMQTLQVTHMSPITKDGLKAKLPCIAIFQDDNQYYRAEIVQILGKNVKVNYVDYGNEATVPLVFVKAPVPQLISSLPVQAIECCLNGYQNMDDDPERDSCLEELLLDQYFVMKVSEVQEQRILVDLISEEQYNVGSLLLQKIAASRGAQASPTMIQEFNKIENRKPKTGGSPSGNSNFRNREVPEMSEWRDRRQNKNNWRDNNSRNGDQGYHQNKPHQRSQDNEWDNKRANEANNSWNSEGNKVSPKQSSWGQSKSPDWGGSGDARPSSKAESVQKRLTRYDNRNDDGSAEVKSNTWYNKNERQESSNKPQYSSQDRQPAHKNRWEDRENDRKPQYSRDDKPRGRWENPSGDQNQPEWSGKPQYSPRNKQSGTGGRREDRNDDFNRKPRRDFHGASSDKSEGSEKSWSSKKPYQGRTNNKGPRDSRNSVQEFVDYAPLTSEFQKPEVTGQTEVVSISWFYNPNNFFVQVSNSNNEFITMMKEIQVAYRKRSPIMDAEVGNSIIAHYPSDNALYRAQILSKKDGNFKVLYVDFGNTAMTRKIYQVEQKFLNLPAQAIKCSLENVSPKGEKWLPSNDFSQYFSGDNLNCQFKSLEETTFLVELTKEDVSIREQLIRANLVQECNPYGDFSRDLLVGQQIKCKLASAKSLSDFSLDLEYKLLVECTLFNLANAQEKFESILLELVGQPVIAYVDEVDNEKLQVTLYDSHGTLITLFTPNEEAFPNVNPLCPVAVLSLNLPGFVSHASDGKLYIQPLKFFPKLETLLNSLYDHYNELPYEEIEVGVNNVYVAKSSDENWYRALVIEIDNDNVTVQFVDYGNTESIPKANLRTINVHFLDPQLALEVKVEDAANYLDKEVVLNLSFDDSGWIGTIVEGDGTSQDHANVVETPVESNVAAEIAVEGDTNVQQSDKEVASDVQQDDPIVLNVVEQPEEELLSIGFSVILSHFDNPGQFFLQIADASETLEAVQQTLQEQVESMAEIETVTAGILCAAPYSADQQWYRAKVLDADSDITTVRFVDYGNTDVLDNKLTKIKTLPTELLSLEEFAKKCSLNLKPLADEWSADACAKFEELTNEDALSVEIVHENEKMCYVKLYANNVCVNDKLIQGNFATELEIETRANVTGFVSHINSPSEFWFQYETACSDLEWVEEQLVNGESFKQLEDKAAGCLCAAVYPDDESWYRARILSNTVAGIEVLFIDYGNSCTSTNLRELPEELVMLSPLAQKCSLQKPAGLLEWPKEATERFKEIAEEGRTVFSVQKHSQGETSVLQLFHNEQDISCSMFPQLTAGFITSYRALDHFYVRKEEDQDKITEFSEKIASVEEKPVEGDPLVGVKSTDNIWYRANVISTENDNFEVELIDSGATASISETNVHKLPSELSDVKPLALKVKLNPLPGFTWSEDSEGSFKDLCKEDTKFEMEINEDSSVRLYLDRSDIRSRIAAAKCTPYSSLQGSPKKMYEVKKDQRGMHPMEEFEKSDVTMLTVADNSAVGNITDILNEITDKICNSTTITEDGRNSENAENGTDEKDQDVHNKSDEGIESQESLSNNEPSDEKEIPLSNAGMPGDISVDASLILNTNLAVEESINRDSDSKLAILDTNLATEESVNKDNDSKLAILDANLATEESVNKDNDSKFPILDAKLATEVSTNKGSDSKLGANLATEDSVNKDSDSKLAIVDTNLSTEESVNKGSDSKLVTLDPNLATEDSVNKGSDSKLPILDSKLASEESVNKDSDLKLAIVDTNLPTEESVNKGSDSKLVTLDPNLATEDSVNKGSDSKLPILDSKLASEESVNKDSDSKLAVLDSNLITDESAAKDSDSKLAD